MSKIYSVTIQHTDEKYAPPVNNLLDVSVIGDAVCLSIIEVEENYVESITKVIDSITVNKADLVYALQQDLRDENERD